VAETTNRWRERFTAPRLHAIRVAPADRTAGAVVMIDGNGARLHAWDVTTGQTRLVPVPPAVIRIAWWLGHDGRYAYMVADQDGNEIGHLTAVDLRGDGPAVDLTPDLPPYTVRGVGISRSGAGLVVDAVNHDGYRLYHLADPAAADPAPRMLAHWRDLAFNCLLSADGAIAAVDLIVDSRQQARSVVQALRVSDGTVLASFSAGAGSNASGVLFTADSGDPTLVVTTDEAGVRRPVLWRVDDDSRRTLRLPQLPGEVHPLDWSDDGRYLLLCHSWRASQQLLRYDLTADRVEPLDLPPGGYHDELVPAGGCRFGPGGAVLAAVESMATPLRVYRHEPGGSTGVVLASAAPPGIPVRSVDIPSSDGTLVQGWLGIPPGAGPGPHPTVIRVHGGPHWVERDSYDPRWLTWLDNGYAYLGLNFRGSTTFGQEYLEAIWGDVGHWETEDIVAARHWLVGQGVADPERVLLTGGSYGGFLTLYALGVRPELWAGGIASLAIADWRLTYQDANPANRDYATSAARFGGTPDERPEAYRERSPITYLPQLAAPVLIRQARGDSRTPARQMEAYEREAHRLGKQVTVLWHDGGHEAPAGEAAFWQQALEFAAGCRRPTR
jgi:dipeptidyl aminopeptidase/acylaminoacyl peptidase